jgi:hypothetical protein
MQMERPMSKEVQLWLEAEARAEQRLLERLKRLREEKRRAEAETEKQRREAE